MIRCQNSWPERDLSLEVKRACREKQLHGIAAAMITRRLLRPSRLFNSSSWTCPACVSGPFLPTDLSH